MTAPYAPSLISPALRGSVDYTDVSLSFQHLAFTTGEAMTHYRIRRKRLAPTAGSDQWWTGSAWGATTDIALAAADGEVVTVDTTGTAQWSSGETYEWAVETRNSSVEWSAPSETGLLYASTVPSLTISIDNPITTSRPTFNWLFTGATGRSQREYQFAVYDNAVTLLTGFDPAESEWAYLWRQDPQYGGMTHSAVVQADLPTGGTFKLYGRVVDDLGLGGAWALLSTFTSSYTPPSSPNIEVSVDAEMGCITVNSLSTFNLIDQNDSSFTSGLGTWTADQNCSLEWNNLQQNAEITFAGGSYAELDAGYGTYDNEDTAFASYDSQFEYRTESHSLVETALDAASVSAATTYSAVCSVTPANRQLNCILSISWYNSGGSLISTTSGGTIACPVGVPTDVYNHSAVAPALSTSAQLSLQVTSPTNAIGEVAYLDKVAMAAGSDVAWTPGGANEGVSFAVQRSEDGGPWTSLWGADPSNPVAATGQGQDRLEIKDRAFSFSTSSIQYRSWAISDTGANPKFSDPTLSAVVELPAIRKWFLRSYADATLDLQIRSESFSWRENSHTEVFLPTGGSRPIVLDEELPLERAVDLSFKLLTLGDLEKFQAIMATKDLVYLQRNSGDSFFFRIIGRPSFRQIRSVGTIHPREVYMVSFTGMRTS